MENVHENIHNFLDKIYSSAFLNFFVPSLLANAITRGYFKNKIQALTARSILLAISETMPVGIRGASGASGLPQGTRSDLVHYFFRSWLTLYLMIGKKELSLSMTQLRWKSYRDGLPA